MARRDPRIVDRIRAAASLSSRQFVDDYLFVVPPWAFRSVPSEYDEFRGELSSRLEVTSAGIVLVGSGRLGFSLNADHLLRGFGSASDLDVVILSSEKFDQTWAELIETSTDITLAGEEERRRLRKTRENFFHGYLRPDHLPLTTKLAEDWFPKLATRFSSRVASRHEVRAWLFKSEVHARAVYSDHLGRIQGDIRRMISFEEST